MLALNLLPAAPAHAFKLQPGSGQGKHVLLLGGGLAGLTAAYELRKLGYRCTILEARERAGGRCWSVRNGSTTQETTNPSHTASFDNGLYFNAGPSRIPHHHQLTMHYCKELGVPLEVYNNVNEGSYYFAEGKGPLSNKKVRAREIHNDVRGYTTELLAKALHTSQVDTGLSPEDAAKVLEFLRAEGGLDIDRLYKASARRGYVEAPGAGARVGKIANPYRLADIVQSGLLDPDFYNVAEYTYELQMTMFQAVGGMDRIAQALQQRVADCLHLRAEVTDILNQPDGVKVTYRDPQGTHELTADLCICTLPLPVLSNVRHNFSGDVSRAIDFVPYIQTSKIGLQFKRRFWEEDEQIYGGITHTNNELTQIFYPSYDYLSQKGILIGYYNFNEKAKAVGELPYAEREQLALRKGQLIHPQYPKEFEHSFSVSWQKQPYSLGGWALYTPEQRQTLYPALLRPEQRVYFAGEHTTYLTAWMAGAFESARSTVAAVHSRLSEQRVAYPSVKPVSN
ncbi:flavin monoamine oxidase family protein [Hymenobacter polaris]|nr:flavin monoamine oxidase family protein [Hymenobacter polaris]